MDTFYAVRVQDLTKHYGDVHAVDGIGFVVKKGEFFGFLGPNGAGKTTTVRMLTGILPPTRGEIEVLGYDLAREGILAKHRIGVVPEMANAYPDLSVWNNLMLMGELYGVERSRRHDRGEELLEAFGLMDRSKQKTKALSKGLRQRLLIAMALVHDPELLFLDEPTSGLDVRSARLIRGLLVSLNDQGSTIFLTTHNIEEANQLCDRVSIINRGKIAATGTPEDLRSTIQSVQSVLVRFEDGAGDMSQLSLVEGVRSVRKERDAFRLLTDDPTDVACKIVGLAGKRAWPIQSMQILGPTLEDAFLGITEEES